MSDIKNVLHVESKPLTRFAEVKTLEHEDCRAIAVSNDGTVNKICSQCFVFIKYALNSSVDNIGRVIDLIAVG